MIYRQLHRLHFLCLLAAVVVNALHPIIHGTPLDGGALDAFIAHVNQWAVITRDVKEV